MSTDRRKPSVAYICVRLKAIVYRYVFLYRFLLPGFYTTQPCYNLTLLQPGPVTTEPGYYQLAARQIRDDKSWLISLHLP